VGCGERQGARRRAASSCGPTGRRIFFCSWEEKTRREIWCIRLKSDGGKICDGLRNRYLMEINNKKIVEIEIYTL
jgi:hypothetical protein